MIKDEVVAYLEMFKKDELVALIHIARYAKESKWLAENGYITEHQMKQTYKYAFTGSKKVERRFK